MDHCLRCPACGVRMGKAYWKSKILEIRKPLYASMTIFGPIVGNLVNECNVMIVCGHCKKIVDNIAYSVN